MQKAWMCTAKTQLSLAHRTVRWCTGQCLVRQAELWWTSHSRESLVAYDYNSPDCPVVHRTVRWSNDRLRQRSATRSAGDAWPGPTVVGAPDCPVCTGQCPVSQDDRCSNGQLSPFWKEIAHRTSYRTCPVVHRTVQCTTRQKANTAFQKDFQRLLGPLGI
jgi:hypothetical protein